MTRQLTFDLPVREALGREDFFVSSANAVALATLDGWSGRAAPARPTSPRSGPPRPGPGSSPPPI